jgi:hypothetical protein
MPVPNIELITSEINFNGAAATIKHHISLLVYSLLRNDIRLNSLFDILELQNEIKSESKFETIRKIDLLFMALYNLSGSEVELVLTEFGKQYSKEDSVWFRKELKKLLRDNTVSPTVTTTAFSPIN